MDKYEIAQDINLKLPRLLIAQMPPTYLLSTSIAATRPRW